MSIQQDEFFAAFEALEAKRASYRNLMAQIAAGEPFDRAVLQQEIEELDVLHKVFLEKSKPFVHWKP
ncbi:hypothetical protein A3K87_04310 [Variovorax paradoxus]|uniref:Uncharacterized protein n=1 Tax=Variovorax paradoxus TaxID=34073 RepID=A0AA91DH39_VARPD|nr:MULTISPECIES: hypothetical protein [Variovorax]OAK55028.1 hypothetical protein A3K87_04310 [Variovorax paradoxus]QRY30580.1 hypothetical protein JVX96_21165 [Variovorax sp. PDNC026]